MTNNAIARRYAKAMVQLGSESGQIDLFRAELSAVGTLFSVSAECRGAFANPAYTAEQKKQLMNEIVAKAGCSEMVSNFLLLLVDKNRVVFLPQIVQAYGTLADEFLGVIRPVIKTAFPLDDAQVASLQGALEKKSGKKVVPQVVVDQSIIGGIVTQVGDIAFDNSITTQLKRIQDILQKG